MSAWDMEEKAKAVREGCDRMDGDSRTVNNRKSTGNCSAAFHAEDPLSAGRDGSCCLSDRYAVRIVLIICCAREYFLCAFSLFCSRKGGITDDEKT